MFTVKLGKRLQMLNHNCKRLPMLMNTIKRLLCLSTKARDFLIKQNYTEKCLTLNIWYTIRGAHNTNQIQTL